MGEYIVIMPCYLASQRHFAGLGWTKWMLNLIQQGTYCFKKSILYLILTVLAALDPLLSSQTNLFCESFGLTHEFLFIRAQISLNLRMGHQILLDSNLH